MVTIPVPRGGIFVGVDGSTYANAALRWAVHEAAMRNVPISLVHGLPVAQGRPPGRGSTIGAISSHCASVRSDGYDFGSHAHTNNHIDHMSHISHAGAPPAFQTCSYADNLALAWREEPAKPAVGRKQCLDLGTGVASSLSVAVAAIAAYCLSRSASKSYSRTAAS